MKISYDKLNFRYHFIAYNLLFSFLFCFLKLFLCAKVKKHWHNLLHTEMAVKEKYPFNWIRFRMCLEMLSDETSKQYFCGITNILQFYINQLAARFCYNSLSVSFWKYNRCCEHYWRHFCLSLDFSTLKIQITAKHCFVCGPAHTQ